MCGIFGLVSADSTPASFSFAHNLTRNAQLRGRDSSGLICYNSIDYKVLKANYNISKLLSKNSSLARNSLSIFGHSRLITNDTKTNQPVVRFGMAVIHNGIILNSNTLWENIGMSPTSSIDSEIILGLTYHHLQRSTLDTLGQYLLQCIDGSCSIALLLPSHGKLLLLSNTGDLFYGSDKDHQLVFASDRYSLVAIGINDLVQLSNTYHLIDIGRGLLVECSSSAARDIDLVPSLSHGSVICASGKAFLRFREHTLQRCTRCILPSTMPFISFDANGVCNYCLNYKSRNQPKDFNELEALVRPYRRNGSPDCIVPFSGGRDSSWALDIICNQLGMKPITYTYDWGMVTDLARRNISRMCSRLQVQNIIIAANIEKKRRNIRMNMLAWLKHPSVSMLSIFTAGDKHFFRHVETVKRRTGILLNLWGVNPLETTHFKAGFLGVPPDFAATQVYMNGFSKQLDFHRRRFREMCKSPPYFNSSLLDTLSGEYYRSFHKKTNYFHVFDYCKWDESACNSRLAEYGWELAPDIPCTWRIGDGTAAFYNYVYYHYAGFTEHDTFRSNQIREGQLSREQALKLVEAENQPRLLNLKWYFDVLGLDFETVMPIINAMPSLY